MNKKFIYPPKTRTDFLQDIVRAMVKRRIDLRMTQEDVNHALNVSDRLVSKWECGTRTPNSFSLYCWADVLKGQILFVPNENVNAPIFKQASNDNSCVCKIPTNDNKLVVQRKKVKLIS